MNFTDDILIFGISDDTISNFGGIQYSWYIVQPYPYMYSVCTPQDIFAPHAHSSQQPISAERTLTSSPGPLRGGERAWYTLNAHAPTFSVKFAVKLIGYCCQHMVEYTEKLGGLRIRSSLERQAYTSYTGQVSGFSKIETIFRQSMPIVRWAKGPRNHSPVQQSNLALKTTSATKEATY